jgi:hypothetical protein
MTAAAWVQAISTVVLVVVTAIYVRLTIRLSKAAQATARASERGLLLDVAPIVLPRRSVGTGAVSGSLHNIGGRPAIEIEMEVMLGEKKAGDHVETMLRSGEQRNWKVSHDPNMTGVLANAPFTIKCDYKAMTGDEFRTVKRYNPGERHDFAVFYKDGGNWVQLSLSEDINAQDR